MARLDGVTGQPTGIDRGAILTEIWKRQDLRRGAQLPLLDVRAEYRQAVEQARWRLHVERHHDRIRDEILAKQRARHGEGWGMSWGGSMALSVMTRMALEAIFER